MTRFTVEEISLSSSYHTGTRGAVIEEMTAALSYMDEDTRQLARRTLDRLHNLTDEQYSGLSLDPADDTEG